MFPFRDRAAGRLAAACGIAAATAAFAAPSANATNGSANKPVAWELSFVDSVSLQPNDLKPDRAAFERTGGLGLTGAERPYARLLRNGSPIAVEDGGGDAWGSVSVPEMLAGDVFQVLDQNTGGLYAQAIYDGRPVFDASTCAGTIKGTGLRTPDASITGVGEYVNVKHPWRYDDDPNLTTSGLITNAGPGTFEATFKRALIRGHVLWADTLFIQSPSVTVTSHSERLVGDCPPPPIPPDTLPPAGASAAPKKVKKLKDLTKKGITFRVSCAEAASVKSVLTLQTTNGKKGKKRKVKQVVVGQSMASVAAGGAVDVTVKIDPSSKKKVKSAAGKKGAKLLLATTLTDGAGNSSPLPVTSVKIPAK
ncbi:MAG: hypothetical protein J7513_08310 [Solirubrobacteraceae bacterium]|nr:hypothetical protein [Solirubrobacteraceae bacterium]